MITRAEAEQARRRAATMLREAGIVLRSVCVGNRHQPPAQPQARPRSEGADLHTLDHLPHPLAAPLQVERIYSVSEKE